MLQGDRRRYRKPSSNGDSVLMTQEPSQDRSICNFDRAGRGRKRFWQSSFAAPLLSNPDFLRRISKRCCCSHSRPLWLRDCAIGFATLAGLQDGYWGSISAIIVLQSNVGSTVTASRDRLIGTLIGAAFGAVFSLLGTGLWPYLSAVVISMVTCSLFGLKNSSRLAAVTVTILMLCIGLAPIGSSNAPCA